jgi:hypothetical protein
MGREGQPFAGATHCTVLHCIKEQKTQIKTKGKQQAQAHLLATSAAHFNPSHITLAFTSLVSTEKTDLQLAGSVPLYLHI